MKNQVKRGTGSRKPPDDPEQSKRFEEAAREIEVDESGKAFKAAITKTLPPLKPTRKSRDS